MDSNASFAGEVEPNVSRDNDFFLRDSFLRTPQLVVGQSAMSSHRKRGSTVPCLCWHWSNPLQLPLSTLVPMRVVALRSKLVGAV